MVNPFYKEQVLNNPKYMEGGAKKPLNKEVANVCSCSGHPKYRLIDLQWICLSCGGHLKTSNGELNIICIGGKF